MAVLTKERWLFSLNTLAFHLLNKTRISQQQNSFKFSHQNWERDQLFAISLASCLFTNYPLPCYLVFYPLPILLSVHLKRLKT